MMGNYLVRFLGGEEGVSLPIYPVQKIKDMILFESWRR